MKISIDGIEEAQAAFEQAAQAVKPTGALGQAVKTATLQLHKYAKSVTHVDTGALRASHIPVVKGAMGQIYINPGSARSDGGRPAQYGPYEHRRGGAHAFYARTLNESGQAARDAGLRILLRGLP